MERRRISAHAMVINELGKDKNRIPIEILLLSLVYFSVLGVAMIVIAISSGILFRRIKEVSI